MLHHELISVDLSELRRNRLSSSNEFEKGLLAYSCSDVGISQKTVWYPIHHYQTKSCSTASAHMAALRPNIVGVFQSLCIVLVDVKAGLARYLSRVFTVASRSVIEGIC